MPQMSKETSMLFDVQYIKPNRQDNPDGILYVIWKDLETGKKYLNEVHDPKMDIYFTKPEYRNHAYSKNYEYLDHCNKKTVSYNRIVEAIVEDGGPDAKRRLSEYYRTKNYSAIRSFYQYPYVYGADYDIRSWYRHKWLTTFDNDRPKKITNGFLDIEVDSFESTGFASAQINPIDLITLIDGDQKESWTFALVHVECQKKDLMNLSPTEREKELTRREMYTSRIKQQDYLIDHLDDLKKELHELFDESYGEIDYHFCFYENEVEMLKHVFELIHQKKLDFIKIWNISFDIPFIMDRLKLHGVEPAKVMCHPDFPIKECWFKKDTRNFEVKNKSDFFHVSDYTVWRDQMIDYAAIRKGREELRSYKLDYIAERVIKDQKLQYSSDGNIKTLSYNNYWKYVVYNIKDVLLQYGIEQKTMDSSEIYTRSYRNSTPYESIFKQTVSLRNVQYNSFVEQGLIPGENINVNAYDKTEDEQDDEKTKFEGALVGDPRLILPVGAEMYGRRSNNIFNFSIDMDMSSFYPSSIYAMNIDPSTLLFKCICDPKQFNNMGGRLKYRGITDYSKVDATTAFQLGDVSKEIIDNFQTGNVVNTMTKWFNAPSIDDLLDEMEIDNSYYESGEI